MMSPPGFSTPPQIPNNTTSERPTMITTMFAATTLENMPFAYRASTSANPNPIISPAFVEANCESISSEKELWDSKKHQTGKEAEEEEMPKVLGHRRSKQEKLKVGE
ncbi:hypothetical protein Tco_0619389 [Tanacetum coccineum]